MMSEYSRNSWSKDSVCSNGTMMAESVIFLDPGQVSIKPGFRFDLYPVRVFQVYVYPKSLFVNATLLALAPLDELQSYT